MNSPLPGEEADGAEQEEHHAPWDGSDRMFVPRDKVKLLDTRYLLGLQGDQ